MPDRRTTPERPALDAVALLESVAFVAIEFERELDLPGLANFVDLYARLLHGTPGDAPVPAFEDFVRDGDALARAARLAAGESGVPSEGTPVPLCGSAERR